MKPTFLGIGSARCSTTWLHAMLKLHPDVQVSEPKELNFFSRRFLRCGLEDYLAHFDPKGDASPKPVRGKISVQYARFGPRRVASVARLLPDAKLLFLIRHPIQRAWSCAYSELGDIRGKRLDRLPDWRYCLHLSRHRSRHYSCYARTLEIWQAAFGRNAVLVCFQEDVREDPAREIRRVLAHIGASTDHVPSQEEVARDVNTTAMRTRQVSYAIPESVRWYVAQQLLPDTRCLSRTLGGRADAWVEEMEQAASGAPWRWRLMRFLVDRILALPERLVWRALERARDVALERKADRWSAHL